LRCKKNNYEHKNLSGLEDIMVVFHR